jgi:serine/threonine protein kinase
VRKNLPPVELFLGQPVPGDAHFVVEEHVGSGCNAHVFRAHAADLKQDAACKIIPKANLVGVDHDPPTWWDEIQKANRIRSQRVVHFFRRGEWQAPGIDCVFLLSEFVRGRSLRAHIKDHAADVGFLVSLLKDAFDFFRELREQGFEHGDFHAGNILVEDRSESLVGPKFAFRVTDFGVVRATSEPAPLDDYEHLSRTVREILGAIDYQTCSAEDRALFNFLRHDMLGKLLLERDPAFDERAAHPARLFRALVDAENSARAAGSRVTRRKLTTPFEFLSCEQIGEAHAILKELYSDKMLGLPTIEDRNNLVLTGPRGCGKTTVFRSLSLRHRFLTEDDAVDSVKYIGVYYRCDDLYFAFPRYEEPARSEAVDLPMHFVVATLLAELLRSLRDWGSRHFAELFEREEQAASQAIWTELRIPKPAQPNVDSFDALCRALERERRRAADKARFANDPKQAFGEYFGPGTLIAICDKLASSMGPLRDRPIYFFVDDYSTPKITRPLQRSLNRLFMQRTPFCFFKLATESPASYEANDIDEKAYVEGREFRLTNLGMDFIAATSEERLRFVDDVFGRRLSYTEAYPVTTLQQLLGDGELPTGNAMARAIRDGKRTNIWGREALGELCSGDVHFLIELVGRMVAKNGGVESLRSGATPAVSAENQNEAVRAEAGRFMQSLRALPNGAPLVDVVEAFGNVAASYLRFKDAKNENGIPPHQASRIEPYEDPRLAGKAKEIYDELLRYSVFIEDVRGKSRRGKVVPRLYLRRFLIPFFNLTFSKRDSVELSVDELTELLTQPRQFESRKRLKSAEQADARDRAAAERGAQDSQGLLPLAGEQKQADGPEE